MLDELEGKCSLRRWFTATQEQIAKALKPHKKISCAEWLDAETKRRTAEHSAAKHVQMYGIYSFPRTSQFLRASG